MRFLLGLLILFLFQATSFAQDRNSIRNNSEQDSARLVKAKIKEADKLNVTGKQALIKDYVIVSHIGDSTFVDTTLSIKKDYKFNYLRKDNFNLISFANIGQTYNTLSYAFSTNATTPMFGARARHFNYMEVEDIGYYHVPTPLTELFYKTAFQQGQVLDAFFTVNTSKQFNFSIGYKGLRSIGNYRNALTSTGNFRFTTNYSSKNEKYRFKTHIVLQDLLNQENGGLQDQDIINFASGSPEFIDRAIFTPNFENAENILEGKRYFLQQEYDIVRPQSNLNKNAITLQNSILLEDKYYQYQQSAASTSFFGNSFTTAINDKVTLQNIQVDLGLSYTNTLIGNLGLGLNYQKINYGYNSIALIEDEIISNRIKENVIGFKGAYSKSFKGFNFNGAFGVNFSDELSGNFLNANLEYSQNDELKLTASLEINSRQPNFNYLLYQSDYINYNWDNYGNFENITTQRLAFTIDAKKIAIAKVDITNISNYTYFAQQIINGEQVVKPLQYDQSLQYVRLKLEREFKFGKFYIDNTLMFQAVNSEDNVFNVPEFIARNTIYFSDRIFKKAMHLQTGITLNYFTKYNMNAYDPLLAEFYVQNETKLGGFPRLDFFINAKVRQTRIYLKAEHFNSSFTGYDYFSAPNNPYRDFTIRFGLVWNFFL